MKILLGLAVAVLCVMFMEAPTGAVGVYDIQFSQSCPSFQFVFVRGSGQEWKNSDDWREFERNVLRLIRRRGYTYKMMDLEYPAVSVSAPYLTALGAFVSAGQSFKFGRSVQGGVASLVAYRSMVQMNCPNTR